MRIKKENFENQIVCGNASWVLKKIPNNSIDLVVTSPPYFGCREYDSDLDGLGREEDPRKYIENIVNVIHQIYPVLKDTGSLYLNIGDVYFGTKGFSRNKGKWSRQTDEQYSNHKIVQEDGKYLQHKQRLMLPERIAIALQDKGWILRNNIIWEKLNPLPCHADDRRLPVYENIFHFVKSKKYYYNGIKSKELDQYRDVIRCAVEPYKNHMATFPEKIIAPLIEITCPIDGVVLDPFLGGGTTAKVAYDLKRKFLGIELSYQYCLYSQERISETYNMFTGTKKLEILIRKSAPKTLKCSICTNDKKIMPMAYWNKFLKDKYTDEEKLKNEYVCEECKRKENAKSNT